MIDFASILHRGIVDAAYHADRTSLSSTGARKLLACPARFRWERDNPPAPKAAFDLGKVAHTLTLGEGGTIAVIDADNWLTKAAKEQRQAAYDAGATPILRADYEAAQAMRDAVYAHSVARELFREGVAELSGWWRDEPTDIGLRFRPDWLTEMDGQPVCVDLKTTISADPAEFVRSVAKFGYHLQASFYLAGLDAHAISDARFLIVAVEKQAPYPVSVIELDTEAITEGRRLMRRAIDLYARCIEAGVWPAYGDDITLISLPTWALSEMEISI